MSLATPIKKVYRYQLWRPVYLKKIFEDQLGIIGPLISKEEALCNIFSWIDQSFNATSDGGSSAYYQMGMGWQASYPETTGYLIPTLYKYADHTADPHWRQRALKAAKWLLSIQSSEGGWQGLQINQKAPLKVFNTGMIIDGLVCAYKREHDPAFFEAALRGAKWIYSNMDQNGRFSKNNHSNGGALDALVVASTLELLPYLEERDKQWLMEKAKFALNFILSLATPNGLINLCNDDHILKNRKTALTHHLGYVLDGLLRSYAFIKSDDCFDMVEKTAENLMRLFEVRLSLASDYYEDWSPYRDRFFGNYSMCLTGSSQMAVVWLRLFSYNKDLRFKNAALKLTDQISCISNRKYGVPGMDNGIAGSYPVNCFYQYYQFVNWAAKYHADALLDSMQESNGAK